MQSNQALQWVKKSLSGLVPDPYFEAQQLLGLVLGCSRVQLLSEQGPVLSSPEVEQLKSLVERRRQQEPLAYLLGRVPFWTFDALLVSSEVLIPRPETELLVETVLKQCQQSAVCVLDLGTGSGAIALALALERPTWQVWGVDHSQAALEIARQNAARYGLKHIQWVQSDWLKGVVGSFDVIVANPPYIAREDPCAATKELAYEPSMALYSDEAGYADLRTIIRQAKTKLLPEGLLALEHGFQQAVKVREFLEDEGYHMIQTLEDLSGNSRVTCGWI